MTRYLAAFPLQGAGGLHRAHLESVAQDEELVVVAASKDFFLAASPSLPVTEIGETGGYVLGDIHSQAGHPVSSEAEAARIGGSLFDPEALVRGFWGNYVAICWSPSDVGLSILRAPFGSLPCLHAQIDGSLVIASDLDMFRRVGLRPAIDENALILRMAFRDLQVRATCIEQVSNIPGGRQLRLSKGELHDEEVWSPWQISGRQHWVESRNEAQDLVRAAVMRAVRACRADAGHPLLLLSGGLDSSILAACLSSLGGGYSSINFVRSNSNADERHYARMVSGKLGSALIECEWVLDHVDLERTDRSSPEPIARLLMHSTNQLLAENAASCGADLTIDGGGGDNVFYGFATVAPVVDALFHGDTIGEAWGTARAIAGIANTSIQSVLRHSASRLLRRPRVFRRRRNVGLLSAGAAESVPELAVHPWLDAPPGQSAGTAAHIGLLLSAQTWAETPDLETPLRHASPLATQPVAAACLRTPSWWWFRDGTSRIVAREAFTGRLPPETINRRSKGSPDSFASDIYAAHRPRIREKLLDGELRRRGLIDTAAIEALTGTPAPLSDDACERVLYLTQVETWLSAQA